MACYFVAIAAGALGPLAVWVWNHMPGAWLCDYGEAESDRHGTDRRRLAAVPWSGLFAAGFVVCGTYFTLRFDGLQWEWLCFLAALWLLLLITLADLHYMVIPDQFVWGLALLGLLMSQKAWLTAILSGVICAFSFFFIAKTACILLAVGDKFQSRKDEGHGKNCASGDGGDYRNCSDCCNCDESRGFGMGDIKLIFALGLLFGLEGSFLTLLAASLLCGVIQISNVLLGRVGMKDERPFGPYLCFCAAVLLLI